MEQQNENIIAAIDVGTTKIVALVGRKNDEGHIEVIGYGRTESSGVRRGAVLNIEEACRSIKKAVTQAEETSGYKITEAYVGIAGQHIRSKRSSSIKNRNSANDAISQADIDFLVSQMRDAPTEMGEEVLHILPQSYTVDDMHDIQSPVGMYGKQLSCDFHIVFGKTAAANNLRMCVERNGIKVKKLILEPLASSTAVLSDDDKELGVALVDIGGGTTDIAIYQNGRIFHTEVIPFGGNSITNDIREGCSILERQAEQLKVQYGSATVTDDLKDKKVCIQSTGGLRGKEITLSFLAEIINARIDEIIKTVILHIDSSGAFRQLGAGIVITGGGSMLKNLRQLFELRAGREVRIGVPNRLIKSNFDNMAILPSNSTSIGLLIMGFDQSLNDGKNMDLQLDFDTKTSEPAQPEPADSTTKSSEPEEKKNKKRAKPIEMLIKGWTNAVDYLTTVEDKQL
ncbi:MAG: cell division protein FtsA [Salinivirgaceae bacterium]|nr:cell division protein FtsA [Salinivirgaceae bacterium]